MIGREKELKILEEAYNDTKSHFIAVYGRRRIGKTYLIREAYKDRFTFTHAGVYNAGMDQELFAFDSSIKNAGGVVRRKSKNWLEAFELLKDVVRQSSREKKIVFIDELSWMDTPKSDMIKALENFWNGWASGRDDIILIVCASATSWMLSKVIHNKGGLYNRLTAQIHLSGFELSQCEKFVKEKNLSWNREQILEYYMIFGGVPFYWTFIKKGMSMVQNVDSVLFAKDAPMAEEFKYLYASVFNNPEVYIKIVSTLSKKKVGMTREEIIENAHISNSGDLTNKLEELESCGFIRKYYAFGMKKKNALYQLIDAFTLFYYQFMENRAADENFWSHQINTPRVNTWEGLAFERVCLGHVDQIKKKLGILGVLSDVNSWYCKSDSEKGVLGSQIDLLIVRRDSVINLCEMKYANSEYTFSLKNHQEMQRKIADLKTVTKTRSGIQPILITTYGLLEKAYCDDIQAVVTMDDLFEGI